MVQARQLQAIKHASRSCRIEMEKVLSEAEEKPPSLYSALKSRMFSTKAPNRLTLISLNIDGLEQRNLKKRTEAVVQTIKESSADIVFLQGVQTQTLSHLQSSLPNYEFFRAQDPDYFVVTLLKIASVKYHRYNARALSMGRHLLAVQAHCGNVVMDLLNTHLESGKEFAAERKKQLEECFGLMSRRSEDRNVIFGGDLNLRDPEVKSVGIPSSAKDVWEQLGSREEVRWTWDLQRNTNKEVEGKWKPRCRFDRLYVRPSQTENLLADQFGLIGLEKVEGTQSFPSDHWGIRLGLKLSQEQ